VVLQSKHMVARMLQSWHMFRCKLPSEVRLKTISDMPPRDDMSLKEPNAMGSMREQRTSSVPNEPIQTVEDDSDQTPYTVRRRSDTGLTTRMMNKMLNPSPSTHRKND
ncbi:unnamed protein product, partial [Dicrocoelium dendriticum]